MRGHTAHRGPVAVWLALLGANCVLATESELAYVPDLGSYHFPTSSITDPECAHQVDRALMWSYGFNQPEARRSIELAVDAEPSCALCFAFKAYALGPFLNKPVMSENEATQAHEAATQAALLVSRRSAGIPAYSRRERGIVQAFVDRHEPGLSPEESVVAFYTAMCSLAAELEDDANVWTWCGEGLMIVQRFRGYKHVYYTDRFGTPSPETIQATSAITNAIELSNSTQPLALHLWIHLTESSPVDDSPIGARGAGRADAAADALEGMAPGSGHLQHMPGHTYSREGRWRDYAYANLGVDFTVGTHGAADGAHSADELARKHGMFAYGSAHNIYAGVHGASTDGQLSLALFGASELRRMWSSGYTDSSTEVTVSGPNACALGGGPGMDAGYNVALLTLARFAQWEAILAADEEDAYPQPATSDCPLAAVFRYYARGLAFAGLRDFGSAEASLRALEGLLPAVGTNKVTPYRGNDHDGAEVAVLVLHARLALLGRDGSHNASDAASLRAAALLEEAAAVQDSWAYSEPPSFYFPVRECYAEVLLHNVGDPTAALQASEQVRPPSAWSLRCRADALREIGDPRAEAAERNAELAWARADVAAGVPSPLPTSCLTFSEQRPRAAVGNVGDQTDDAPMLLFGALCAGCILFVFAKYQRGREVKYQVVQGEESTALVDDAEQKL